MGKRVLLGSVAGIDHLSELRLAELRLILSAFPSSGRVLEIGAGTGRQAAELQALGYETYAVDLPESYHAADRVFPIIDYDGARLPFPSASFDVVFSSNVLAHVRDLDGLHAEIRRVLAPGGVCIHTVPTPAWRLWTMLTGVLVAVRRAPAGFAGKPLPIGVARFGWRLAQPIRLKPLGSRGNAVTELFTFRARWWRDLFARNGFVVVAERPVGLFYTGGIALGRRLSIGTRTRLAAILGSACRLYVTRPSA